MNEDDSRHFMTRFRQDWPGVCAFMLSLGIAISMVAAMVSVISDTEVSPQGAQLLSTIFGAAIGAVATYLGTARQQQQGTARTRKDDDVAQNGNGGSDE